MFEIRNTLQFFQIHPLTSIQKAVAGKIIDIIEKFY